MNRLSAVTASLFLISAGICAQDVDADQLPREVLTRADGSTVQIVRHLNTNWVECAPEILKQARVGEPAVCFRAKFAACSKNTLALLRHEGTIKVFEDATLKKLQTFKPGDNVLLFGELRMARDGKGIEMVLQDVLGLKGDFEYLTGKVNEAIQNKAGQALLELGNEARRVLAEGLLPFAERGPFIALQRKSFKEGLRFLEEKAVADLDADQLFLVAEKHLELLQDRRARERIVRKILRDVDPEHRRSAEVAAAEWGMSQLEGVWVTQAEREAILRERMDQEGAFQADRQAKIEAALRTRRDAAAKRAEYLARHQTELRASAGDLAAFTRAFESLGSAIRQSPDAVFGRRAVEVLSNHPEPAAVYPGLDLAAQSQFPEVRRDVYEALAWRGGEPALKTLGEALRGEADAQTVQAGVQVLVRRSDRPALEVLIEALSNEHPAAQAEVVEGLKTIARLNLPDKSAWLRWWETNKDRGGLAPKAE